MRYHADAEEFIKELQDFTKEEFETWIYKQEILIGSNPILQYLEEKKRWNNTAFTTEEIKLRLQFSNQAMSIIKKLKVGFDYEDCKRWFYNSMIITKTDILNYIETNK